MSNQDQNVPSLPKVIVGGITALLFWSGVVALFIAPPIGMILMLCALVVVVVTLD